MSRPLRMGPAALVVSAGVLLSRILGLAREALLAGLIGVNVEGDLYRQAFSIPDFLNYLLAGGYLTITLIPILSRHLEAGDDEGAVQAFSSVYRFALWAIVVLTAVVWLAAAPLVGLVFPEVTGATQARLVTLTRVVLPAQIFFVLGSVLVAAQYTHRRFLYPALAPVIYNLGIIVGGSVSALLGNPGPEGFLLGAVAGSAIGNFALQWLGARRVGMRLVAVPPGGSAVREYLVLALPLMLGQSIAVLDEQFVRWFGQVEQGATAALSFARQLNMVPVGVIAQAAGVAAFPFLARLASRDDGDGLAETTGRAARNTTFIAMAAAAVLVVVAGPVVRLLYRYGRFTAEDADLVARLLSIYAFSIPAWGLHQIVSRHFYAKRRMWVPVLVGTSGTAAAVPVWLFLYARIGVEGFALASVIMMTAYALAMVVYWGSDSGWSHPRRLLPSLLRAGTAAAVAILAARPVTESLYPSGEASVSAGVAGLLAGAAVSLVVFWAASALVRAPELKEILGRQ